MISAGKQDWSELKVGAFNFRKHKRQEKVHQLPIKNTKLNLLITKIIERKM